MSKKIIILSRISTDAQNIASQTNELINEAIKLGYSKSCQIIIESVESAIKLSESERIGIQQLKYHIENDSDVDSVICWEPSRLSRQQATLYNLRDYLLKQKIQLYILNPYMKLLTDDRTQIDTTASIVFSLFCTISENEMLIKKERFMRAKNELTKQGKKSAGSVIFGYVKDKYKNCVPHPLHSQIISDIFNHYITHDDASLYETYIYATSKWPELFPMLEYKKAQHKIRHLFDTSVYSEGNWCYPAIISKEVMDQTKAKMNKARCKARYNSKLELLGRGKVRCKHCGNIMTGCGGNVNAYYCSTDKLHSLQISTETLDWLIWEEVRVAVNIISNMNNSSGIIEIDNKIKAKQNLINQLEMYINSIKDKQDKLLTLYLNNKINEELYNSRYDALRDELNSKTDEINALNIQINELKLMLNDNIFSKNTINYDGVVSFENKLELVRKYLDCVLVSKNDDKSIMIEFKWTQNLIVSKCIYKYTSKGGRKKIYRINEDGTIDWIY